MKRRDGSFVSLLQQLSTSLSNTQNTTKRFYHKSSRSEQYKEDEERKPQHISNM
jgi:predicted glycosyltransferase involved in capsule biosynthesis